MVLGAKLMGTAAVARLFALTQPALMRLAWFAHAYGRWKRWKDQLLTRFRATPAWHSVTVLAQQARLRASAVVRGLRDWLRPERGAVTAPVGFVPDRGTAPGDELPGLKTNEGASC